MSALPSKEDFLSGIENGVIYPVYAEIPAPGFDPAAAFHRLEKDDYSFLLESARSDVKVSRFWLSQTAHPFRAGHDHVIGPTLTA
jgi:hypothetical protein